MIRPHRPLHRASDGISAPLPAAESVVSQTLITASGQFSATSRAIAPYALGNWGGFFA
jgi:hypothetical protein